MTIHNEQGMEREKVDNVICSKYRIISVQLVVFIICIVLIKSKITFEGATAGESLPSEVRYVPGLITTMKTKCYLFFRKSLFLL